MQDISKEMILHELTQEFQNNVLEKKKPNLTKKKLAAEVAYLLDLPMYKHRVFHGKAYNVVNTIFKVVIEALQRGESVSIPGFGIFQWHERPSMHRVIHYSYNGKPATKNSPKIVNSLPSKRRVIFKPSKVLQRIINDNMS